MFGGGNVKLEATFTIDISRTDILFLQRASISLSSLRRSNQAVSVLCIGLAFSGHAYHSSFVTSFCQSLILLTEVTTEVLVAYQRTMFTNWVL